MILLGILLITVGLIGAWGGPIDRDRPDHWMAWLSFVFLAVLGCELISQAHL